MNICIIPAKYGSSRLPKKNFLEFHGGLNLTEILILKLKKLDFKKIIVSCENDSKLKELSRFCHNQNIENVNFHLREDYLSRDPSTIVDVINAIMEDRRLIPSSDKIKKLIVCLPTAPLVTEYDIKSVLKLLDDYCDHRVLSISQSSKPPFNAWTFEDNQKILKLTFPDSKFSTTQSTRCPQTYMSNGAVSGWNLSKNKSLNRTSVVGFEMPEHQAFDVDTRLEFEIAQFVFKKYFKWENFINDQ